MDIEAFDKLIRALNRRSPFRPYTVELVNGERIEVNHPEAMVFQRGAASYLSPDFVPSWFTHEGVARIVGETERSAAAK